MIIYATPFRQSDKKTTGPSTDSGFKSINQVIVAMGDDYMRCNSRLVIYGQGEDQVVFSDFIFCVDPDVSNG